MYVKGEYKCVKGECMYVKGECMCVREPELMSCTAPHSIKHIHLNTNLNEGSTLPDCVNWVEAYFLISFEALLLFTSNVTRLCPTKRWHRKAIQSKGPKLGEVYALKTTWLRLEKHHSSLHRAISSLIRCSEKKWWHHNSQAFLSVFNIHLEDVNKKRWMEEKVQKTFHKCAKTIYSHSSCFLSVLKKTWRMSEGVETTLWNLFDLIKIRIRWPTGHFWSKLANNKLIFNRYYIIS